MTITPEQYIQINDELIQVLENHKDEGMTEYDMLLLCVNLLTSYMELLARVHQFKYEELEAEVHDMIRTDRKDRVFTSKN